MLRSMKDLKGYTIAATDGEVGSVHTFYFDDTHWAVRYLVVDTRGWLGHSVLISPIALGSADWSSRQLSVNLTKDRVEHSPGFNTDRPVSRQHELDYYNYYGWPYYWSGPYVWGASMYPGAMAGAGTTPAAVVDREQGDPHLRSVEEVIGYHIQATDERIGRVADFIVDDETWQLRYMVVDTSNWWFGNEVLVATEWIDHVSWDARTVSVNLTRATVKDSPRWDASMPINRAYEERLYDYYGRPTYWRSPEDSGFNVPADEEKGRTTTIAPLEYLVIRMQDDQFSKEILPVLAAIQQAGNVRVVDLLFVAKDAAGAMTTREVDELGDKDLRPYGDLAEDLQGLLTADDIACLAADLAPMGSAVIVLLEHRWVQELSAALGKAGSTLLTGGLVSPDALARVNQELAAVPV